MQCWELKAKIYLKFIFYLSGLRPRAVSACEETRAIWSHEKTITQKVWVFSPFQKKWNKFSASDWRKVHSSFSRTVILFYKRISNCYGNVTFIIEIRKWVEPRSNVPWLKKDHLEDWKNCCFWLTFRQPVRKPESSDSVNPLKIQKPWRAIWLVNR